MASPMVFTDSSSSTTSRLINFNRCSSNSFLLRQCVGHLRLRTTTAPLSIRCSSSPTHSVKITDGEAVAKTVRDGITLEVSRMKESIGVIPGLAMILLGDPKTSGVYARIKKEACESVGMKSFEVRIRSEEKVLKAVAGFNDDPCVHGIILQRPVNLYIDTEIIFNAVSVEKDVDGYHPVNLRQLAKPGRKPLSAPCIAKGCVELLHRYNYEIKGKKAVVIGSCNVVGVPFALLLEREGATVSIIPSETDTEEIAREADIVITSVGQPNMVKRTWIKPGAVIIDVRITPVRNLNAPHGFGLIGDVCFEETCKVASAITRISGGIGQMTLAMLLSNTLTSAKRIHNFQ